jgi:hypothetical protein
MLVGESTYPTKAYHQLGGLTSMNHSYVDVHQGTRGSKPKANDESEPLPAFSSAAIIEMEPALRQRKDCFGGEPCGMWKVPPLQYV